MKSYNEMKVILMMRLQRLQTVYQMLQLERSVLDVPYIEAEIEKAEIELDKLNESREY